MQGSVQERLEVLEGRQQSEEAYLSSLQVKKKNFTCFTVYQYKITNTDVYFCALQELQQAILSQSATIQVLIFSPRMLVA